MNRMDKYETRECDDIKVSRTLKNQDMYKDVYLNNTLVDIKTVLPNDNEIKNEENVIINDQYEEKSYDINDYLTKAKDNRIEDNLKRSLDNTDCEVDKVKDKQDEISKLIESINKKEQESDFFNDLLPDSNENTIVTDPIEETKLNSVIDEEVIYNYVEETKEVNDGFQDIVDEKKDKVKKHSKKIPIIIFVTTLLLLIGIIVFLLLK